MLPGDAVASCDGRFVFVVQGDGNVVLYDAFGTALWNTHTQGEPNVALVLMENGELVLFGPEWSVLWRSHTDGQTGASLAVQDDGNVVLYGPAGAAWSTGTCWSQICRPATPAPALAISSASAA